MSCVHKEICEAALRVLPEAERSIITPYWDDMALSCGYPDIFADKSKRAELCAKYDSDAERFLWPEPPVHEAWFKKLMEKTEKQWERGMVPTRFGYLAEHYLQKSLEALRANDHKSLAKHLGVYSHAIGDTTEPIHAVHPHIVDFVVPPPEGWIGFELHAGTEMLFAPVNIDGYTPKILGDTIEQAAMGAIAGLCQARDVGAALIVPLTQAIYAGDRPKAISLSSEAQNESARHFADYMHTVFWIFQNRAAAPACQLDLSKYPWFSADVDMLYRFRPLNCSLVPYDGVTKPLAVPAKKGVEEVTGLGVLPFLGPPYIAETRRHTGVEFLLVPGAFKTFRARIGVNPLFEESGGGVVFRVLVDGEEKFVSDSLTIRSAPAEVSVPLDGARWLELTTDYAPNASASEMAAAKKHLGWASHAVWAEPRLTSE